MQTVVADGRPEEKETLVEMLDSWYQGINSDELSDDTTHFLPFCTSLMNTAQDSSACVQAAKCAHKIIVENMVLCNRMEIVRAAYRGLDRMGAFWCLRQDLSVDELYEWLLLDHQIHSSTDLEAMLRAPQQLRTKTQTRTWELFLQWIRMAPVNHLRSFMKLASGREETLVPIKMAWQFHDGEPEHPVTDDALVPKFKVCFQRVELPYWPENLEGEDFFLMMQHSCEEASQEHGYNII